MPRYHIVWGTSRELTRRMIAPCTRPLAAQARLLHQHRVHRARLRRGKNCRALAVEEATGREVRLAAPVVVLAMGGINGSHEQVRRNWPQDRPRPASMLNGAHSFADGQLHQLATGLGAQVTHAGEMWNYAAGFPHPYPQFPATGCRDPCKSALWMDHRGERIGPEPLVTGFDTHWLCQRVAEQDKPWTCTAQLALAAKEFASPGRHNTRIRAPPVRVPQGNLLGHHRGGGRCRARARISWSPTRWRNWRQR